MAKNTNQKDIWASIVFKAESKPMEFSENETLPRAENLDLDF